MNFYTLYKRSIAVMPVDALLWEQSFQAERINNPALVKLKEHCILCFEICTIELQKRGIHC